MEASRYQEVLRADGLEVRPGEFTAIGNGRVLKLSARELNLLATLLREQGRILSREELYRLVWGGRMRPDDRSVDVYIHKLRVKLARRRAGNELHPHPFRLRLPLQPRAFTSW